MKKYTILVALSASLLAACGTSSEPHANLTTPVANNQNNGFQQLTDDLKKMEQLGILSGGGAIPVSFDKQTAEKNGFSTESINLAQQSADYANEIVEKGKNSSAGLNSQNVDFKKYDALNTYFEKATEYNREHNGKDQLNAQATAGETCGDFQHPLPSRAAPRLGYSSANPAGALRSMGYHETPGYAGGGWTKGQTWNRPICGDNTFRDHGIVESSSSYSTQTYAYWSPRGEPNPEVWTNVVWPYTTWPNYVKWWHDTY